jgi:hypothetical protein
MGYRRAEDWKKAERIRNYKGPRLVSFVGGIGAGKSTAAKYLADEYGFVLVRFAGPLKDMIRALGCTPEEVDGALKETPSEALCGLTPRHAMQSLGTEWGRNCMGADFWTRIWERRVRALLSSGRTVVVDDCRFENEDLLIRDLGGVHVRVFRPGIDTTETHVSEAYKVQEDYLIINKSAFKRLHSEIDSALVELS